MKVAVISHAYQDERYLKVLETMTQSAHVQIVLIYPKRYKGMQCRWIESHSIEHVAVPIVFGSRQGAFFYDPSSLMRTLIQQKPNLILHEQEVYTLGAAEVALA